MTCPGVSEALHQIDMAEPMTYERVTALVWGAKVLTGHGWRYPYQLPVRHVISMLHAEARHDQCVQR